LDEEVKEAGVRDASSFPIPGFPYLRTNRFLSALKHNLKDDREMEQLSRWMQQLDLSVRKKEISNLPDKVILFLDSREEGQPDREELYSRVKLCSCKLLDHDQTRSDFYEILYPFVDVPDEYSLFMRAIGLYPLVSIPVIIATGNVREKFRSWYNADTEDLPIEGHLKSLVPPEEVLLQERVLQEMFEESKKNPLRVPWLDGNQERRLAASFAPIFIQDIAAPYDQFGRVVWKGDCPKIKTDKPTVYYYTSHAFMKGEPILQINYVIWYSERAGGKSPWIERGSLDGLTTRVSLDTQGKPFMVDVMNNCGCYHLFVPQKERLHRVVNKRFRLDPFVPQWLPTISSGKRLGIRINSGWHQIERLLSMGTPPDAIPYELVSYDTLEALPHEDGRSESIFNAKGVAKCSKRIEPFIFFSMGIDSIGYMRQRSNHAIALTGRVHFDDPYLFDRNFVFK